MMKKVFASMLVLATAAVFMVGCSSAVKTIPGASIEPQKADYKILGEITGQGEATRIIGINFKTLFSKKGAWRTVPVIAGGFNPMALLGEMPSAVGDAKELAMYDAISKLDNADMMIDPKWSIEETNLFIIDTAKATVKAKGIQLTGPSAAK